MVKKLGANSSSTGDCSGACKVEGPACSSITWMSAVTQPFVVETVFVYVDRKAKTSKIETTRLNTSSILAKGSGSIYAPQHTNEHGTVDTKISFSGSDT